MKVLRPERVLVVKPTSSSAGGVPDVWHHQNGTDYIFGVPLTGTTVDVDDYFVQASAHGDINDVVHGKVVGFGGGARKVFDTLVEYNGKKGYLPTDIVFYTSRGKFDDAYAIVPASITVDHVEEVYPRNYRGKKTISPRQRVWKSVETIYVAIRCTVFSDKTTSASRKPLRHTAGCDLRLYFPSKRMDRGGRKYVLGLWTAIEQYDFIGGWEWGLPDRYASYGPDPTIARNIAGNVRTSLEGASASEFAQFARHWIRAIAQWEGFGAMIHDLYESAYPEARAYEATVTVHDAVPPVSDIRSGFLLQEPEVFGERIDPLLLGKDIKFRGYWRNFLTQHALLDALESFPKLNDNSISNIMEVVGFVKTLVLERRIEIPKSWQEAWLSYRYVYSTTKLDVKEAVRFVRRMSNLHDLSKGISCHGVATTEVDGVPVTCRAVLSVKPRNVSILDSLMRNLDTYGLTPDFYVIWDMTPFSFMVDWFLPIADVLSTLDADAKYFSGEWYDLSNLCYSFSYSREIDGTPCGFYTRWKGSIPTALNSYYWFESPSVGSKTVVKRVLDAAALFIGGG